MDQGEWEAWIESLDGVVREDSWGYSMFYVGDERMAPFVSIAAGDSEYDAVSNLAREGVFRLNIGVGRVVFEQLFPDGVPDAPDYSALNTIVPHPHYAQQNYVCILNPEGAMVERTQALVVGARDLVAARVARRGGGKGEG